MSSSPDRKRTGRTSKPTVAVTGAAARLGEALTGKLAFGGEVRRVVGLAAERGAAPATWRLGEVTDPHLAERLNGVDTLVHLAVDADLSAEPRARTARNVAGSPASPPTTGMPRLRMSATPSDPAASTAMTSRPAACRATASRVPIGPRPNTTVWPEARRSRHRWNWSRNTTDAACSSVPAAIAGAANRAICSRQLTAPSPAL